VFSSKVPKESRLFFSRLPTKFFHLRKPGLMVNPPPPYLFSSLQCTSLTFSSFTFPHCSHTLSLLQSPYQPSPPTLFVLPNQCKTSLFNFWTLTSPLALGWYLFSCSKGRTIVFHRVPAISFPPPRLFPPCTGTLPSCSRQATITAPRSPAKLCFFLCLFVKFPLLSCRP